MSRRAAAALLLAACAPRGGLATASSAASAGASAPPPLAPTASPEALAELVAAAPSGVIEGAEPRIGRGTGLPEGEDARPAAPGERHVGVVRKESPIAAAAVERRARRELYFPLLQRCASAGPPLPPDAVRIELTLAPDGRVEPASVLVRAERKEHAAIAACMRKEVAATTFRGPSGPPGVHTPVILTVPSVD